ncbi:DUF4430 domain-containing protein [Chitinophaga nivalis]|uniref:DUF4430 domain-containing protein n=1 Tax=Chitinophaga nivalis TaxID=2991709 RepID=A0ABT3IMX7_9BACT|nr:DUF4430 domain-containing protein [Chitinophaga nivalis]MCW3464986.1 DUF4430 domain-containing protein [Chitinophaga nivalis]MCW3485322.1 DUF4430 domain-containing protein [Chitinophaga nivalis]
MVTLTITGGPSIQFPWQNNMTGQTAMEAAYNASASGTLTFLLQFYGSSLGYLVDMINGTFDTAISSGQPYFFWDFIVNGVSSSTGIDSTSINDGDVITFTFTTYNAEAHAATTLANKFKVKSAL